MQISSRIYGTASDGRRVTQYIMESKNGVRIACLDYGCIITNLWVRDRTGKPTDIVLGYDDIAAYEKDDVFFGACVGRVANRIKDSRFTLNGQDYRLQPNDGLNHLHGVFHKRLFAASVSGGSLRFTYRSPDGEDGFPGGLDVTVTYTLDDNDVFSMRYEAVSDADTLINLTNHSYFNLSGHQSGSVDQQLLEITADTFLETADDACPTGIELPVEGTPMDFRTLRHIGQGFPIQYEQMELVSGYDHCYCLRENAAPAALAYSPVTGIAMSLVTTQPGIQFYSGNHLGEGGAGKGGIHYGRRAGFCLETEHYPCANSYPDFPSILLRRGEKCEQTTLLQFQTLEKL